MTDHTAKILKTVGQAYLDAEATGKARPILIPTQGILPPVDPMRVASQFAPRQFLAVSTAADALVDIYHTPSYETLRDYARAFDELADALEFS